MKPPACVGGAWIWPRMRWGALAGPGPGTFGRFFSGCCRAGRLVGKLSGRTPLRRGVAASWPKPPGTPPKIKNSRQWSENSSKKNVSFCGFEHIFKRGEFFKGTCSANLRAPPGTKPTKRPVLPDQGVSRPRLPPSARQMAWKGCPARICPMKGCPARCQRKQPQKWFPARRQKKKPKKWFPTRRQRKKTQKGGVLSREVSEIAFFQRKLQGGAGTGKTIDTD